MNDRCYNCDIEHFEDEIARITLRAKSAEAALDAEKATCERLRKERDESQIVAAYIAADFARDREMDPYDVLDTAKKACREAIALVATKE